MRYNSLTREEVISVIEGKSIAPRVPILLHNWVSADNFREKKKMVEDIISQYPCDVQGVHISMPDFFEGTENDPQYRWIQHDKINNDKTGIDGIVLISDEEFDREIDDIIRNFPDPYHKDMYTDIPASDGRYRMGGFYYCLFERHWKLRGMANALMDFYIYPDSVHKLYQAFTDFYKVVIERGKIEADIDGFFSTDDIGTQAGPFFSVNIFKEFFMPYYRQIINKAHEVGSHFWLHSCGNIEMFIPEFIEIGLDVLHPIQKYTMDERKIAKNFGKDICIWAGFDVQQIIPWGTPEEVRQEVKFMMDIYYRTDGRFMFTAGNAIHEDCPLKSLEALFDEAFKYGTEIAGRKHT